MEQFDEEVQERLEAALRGAISARNKNKGKLKMRCPQFRTNSDAAIMWYMFMREVNVHKTTMIQAFYTQQDKEFSEQCEEFVKHLKSKGLDMRKLDKDRWALDAIAKVW